MLLCFHYIKYWMKNCDSVQLQEGGWVHGQRKSNFSSFQPQPRVTGNTCIKSANIAYMVMLILQSSLQLNCYISLQKHFILPFSFTSFPLSLSQYIYIHAFNNLLALWFLCPSCWCKMIFQKIKLSPRRLISLWAPVVYAHEECHAGNVSVHLRADTFFDSLFRRPIYSPCRLSAENQETN